MPHAPGCCQGYPEFIAAAQALADRTALDIVGGYPEDIDVRALSNPHQFMAAWIRQTCASSILNMDLIIASLPAAGNQRHSCCVRQPGWQYYHIPDALGQNPGYVDTDHRAYCTA